MTFAFWVVAGFVLTEALSYVLHRYLFHGPLWGVHKSHHSRGTGRLELNDVFSVFFSGLAVAIMVAADDVWNSIAFPLGTGITVYGILYFIAHDAFTHRRVFGFQSSWKWLNSVRTAHRRHHQSAAREGQEPYGLFWYRGYERAPEARTSSGKRAKSG